MDKRHWRCVLPAFCMVGLSISSASASSCLCRASRWTQLRLCSREFGRRLKRKTCWLPTYSVVHFQSCMWLRWALMSSNKSSNVLLLQHKFTLVVFLCWCSHLSCARIRLLADFILTRSLGCRLAWSICWKTPAGVERRAERREAPVYLHFFFSNPI